MLDATSGSSFVPPQKSTTDRPKALLVPGWMRTGFRVTGAVAPGAAALLARQVFFTPPRTPLRVAESAVLARGERFSLVAAGGQVVGHSWGEGPTVLLVHGWGGHAGHMTALVDPLLAAGFRAVALDLPAHGESAGRLSSLVHFGAALARAAALFGPVHGLVAHSFGAAGSTYQMSRGLAVGRAVFVAPPARFDGVWSRFRESFGVGDEVWRRMVADVERWLAVSFADIAPVDLAPAMTTPLLILHDQGDREVPIAEGAELASRWPGAVLVRREGLGHLRILRDGSAVAQAVAFLAAA